MKIRRIKSFTILPQNLKIFKRNCSIQPFSQTSECLKALNIFSLIDLGSKILSNDLTNTLKMNENDLTNTLKMNENDLTNTLKMNENDLTNTLKMNENDLTNTLKMNVTNTQNNYENNLVIQEKEITKINLVIQEINKIDPSTHQKPILENKQKINEFSHETVSKPCESQKKENYTPLMEDEQIRLTRRPKEEDNKNFEKEIMNLNTFLPDDKSLKIINHVLEVMRIFNFNLKKKENLETVEILNIDDMECFCYHYSRFKGLMKNFLPSPDFIWNQHLQMQKGYFVFYSSDFKFAIKIVKKNELQTSIDNIEYINHHYEKHRGSLIVPIAGIYSTPKCYFIVMKNIFESPNIEIFDLKGENINRKEKNCKVDKDWKCHSIPIENKTKIIECLRKDTYLLEALEVMDYSLIVGIPMSKNFSFKLFDTKGREKPLDLGTESHKITYGIVDVFTYFDWKKKIESLFYKFTCMGPVSCVNPEKYGRRFTGFVSNKVFKQIE